MTYKKFGRFGWFLDGVEANDLCGRRATVEALKNRLEIGPEPSTQPSNKPSTSEDDSNHYERLDRERARHDRRLRRGCDYDSASPGYCEFLDARLAELTATLVQVEGLRSSIVPVRLREAQQTVAAFAALIDRDFEHRDWGSLRADLRAFLSEIRALTR